MIKRRRVVDRRKPLESHSVAGRLWHDNGNGFFSDNFLRKTSYRQEN